MNYFYKHTDNKLLEDYFEQITVSDFSEKETKIVYNNQIEYKIKPPLKRRTTTTSMSIIGLSIGGGTTCLERVSFFNFYAKKYYAIIDFKIQMRSRILSLISENANAISTLSKKYACNIISGYMTIIKDANLFAKVIEEKSNVINTGLLFALPILYLTKVFKFSFDTFLPIFIAIYLGFKKNSHVLIPLMVLTSVLLYIIFLREGNIINNLNIKSLIVLSVILVGYLLKNYTQQKIYLMLEKSLNQKYFCIYKSNC